MTYTLDKLIEDLTRVRDMYPVGDTNLQVAGRDVSKVALWPELGGKTCPPNDAKNLRIELVLQPEGKVFTGGDGHTARIYDGDTLAHEWGTSMIATGENFDDDHDGVSGG